MPGHRLRWAAAGLVSVALAAASATAASAVPSIGSASVSAARGYAATSTALGTKSLASVLLADGNTFDHNWYDYDIVTEAVLAVLAAPGKDNSTVKALTDGTLPLTAFLPNDRAFQVLVADLTGNWLASEEEVLAALASLGIAAVEAVLRYHVVPGATIDSRTALASDGARLATALPGAGFTVDLLSKRWKIIRLIDNDPDDINPYVNPWALDINKGNVQIAHGITFVLRPVNL